eukprot:COSAG01_NODE_172_length_23108_cov_26.690496_20_plen_204_part_00
MNIFFLDHSLSLWKLDWTNFVYNFNPIAWSGVELFFKHVEETIHDKMWGEEIISYMTFDYQYTRFDTQTSWASSATPTKPAVFTFYLRSSLRRENTIISPELRLSGLFAQIGGMWVTWDGTFVMIATAPAILAHIYTFAKRMHAKRTLKQSYLIGIESEDEKTHATKSFEDDFRKWSSLCGKFEEIPATKQDMQTKIIEMEEA